MLVQIFLTCWEVKVHRVFVPSLIIMTLGGPLFQSAEAARHASSARGQARISVLWGDQLYLRGDLRAARIEYEKALRFFEQVRDDLGVAECLGMLGRVDLDLFQVDSAKSLFERALAIRERNLPAHHVDLGESHQNLANLFFASGNFKEARGHYLQAIEIGRRTLDENSPDLATALRSLGQLAQMEGRNGQAELLYREALRMLESSLGLNDWKTAETRVVLAKHLAFEGDLENGRTEIENGLRVLETALGPSHLSTLGAQLAASTVARLQGDLQRAVELLTRIESGMQQAIPSGHPFRGEYLHEAALFMRDFGRGQEAEGLLRQSLRIKTLSYGADHPNSLKATQNLATLLHTRGKSQEASGLFEELHERVLRIFPSGSPEVASFLDDRSIFLLETGQVESGLEILEKSLAAQDLVIRSLLDGTSDRELQLLLDEYYLDGAISAHLKHAPTSRRAGRLAFEAVLRRKNLDLDVALRSHRRTRHGGTAEHRVLSEDLEGLRDEQIRLWMGLPLQISEPSRLTRLEKLRREIDTKERQAGSRLYSPVQRSAITVEAAQGKLEPKQALLEFVNYAVIDSSYLLDPLRIPQTRYAVGILGTRGEPTWVDLGPASEIDELAIAFRESLSPGGVNFRETGQKLYNITFGRFESLLCNVEKLEISPAGSFQFIPIAALIDRQGQYLVERFSINHVPSGRDLLLDKGGSTQWRGALLVGGLEYGSIPYPLLSTGGLFDGLSFSKLESTGPEVTGIQSILGTGQVWTGLDAKESRFDEIQGPTILHLATHGFFLSDQSMDSTLRDSSFVQRRKRSMNPLVGSGLALSQANNWREAQEANDGILTAFEMRELDLSQTELAVLSACETGLGEGVYNRGVYGMRRALSKAGVRSHLLSLWPVSDRITRHFMMSFYGQLKSGVDRTEALMRVQRAFVGGKPLPETGYLLRGGELIRGSPRTSHPFFWAGFVLSGARGPVSIPKELHERQPVGVPDSAKVRNSSAAPPSREKR